MSFLQLEAEKVLADAEDNRKIEGWVREFQELKGKYADAEKQIGELVAEVAKLKETNRMLEEGRQKHKHSQSAKDEHHHHYHHHPLDREPPLPFSQTHSSFFHVQQTKRKVINGFVAELTSELQTSEQLLTKERLMHEEMRRNLQASHNEVLALKASNRALEGELAAVMAENRQLLGEVNEIQAKKDAMESQMQLGAMEVGWRRGALGRRSQQVQEQFLLMDSIYSQIEAQLSGKCVTA